MDPLTEGPLVKGSPGEDGTYRVKLTERMRDRVIVSRATDTHGWQVYATRPLLNVQLQSTRYYVFTLALLLVALFGGVLASRRYASGVTQPLENLVTLLRNVSVSGASTRAEISADQPVEVSAVLATVNDMQRRLAESYQQLERAVA